ncbi:MAG: hypothetical protein ABW076_17050 [Candidatus Thiodiazotropha sp.]
MSNKSQTDHSDRHKEQAPKGLSRDYSSVPQKPIKLKDEVSLHPALKGEPSETDNTRKHTPPPRRSRKKPAAAKPVALFDGLSPEAREIILNAANTAGLEPLAWLDRFVCESSQIDANVQRPDNAELMRMLQTMDERLQRLEDQRGFWSRFWEQFMNPPGRTD